MAVTVPTHYPLYRAGLAEDVAELSPIHADPAALALIDAVTWSYAVPARPLLLSFEPGGGDYGAASIIASGASREVLARGGGTLSPSTSSVTWRLEIEEADVLVEVYAADDTTLISSTTQTAATRAVYSGSLSVSGHAGLVVRPRLSIRQRASATAILYQASVQEDPVTAANLPL